MQVDHAQVIQGDHQVLLQSMQDQTQRGDWLMRALPGMADAVSGIAFKLNDLKLNADQRRIQTGQQYIQDTANNSFRGNVNAAISADDTCHQIALDNMNYGMTGSFAQQANLENNPFQIFGNIKATGSPTAGKQPDNSQTPFDQAIDKITGKSLLIQNAGLNATYTPAELQGKGLNPSTMAGVQAQQYQQSQQPQTAALPTASVLPSTNIAAAGLPQQVSQIAPPNPNSQAITLAGQPLTNQVTPSNPASAANNQPAPGSDALINYFQQHPQMANINVDSKTIANPFFQATVNPDTQQHLNEMDAFHQKCIERYGNGPLSQSEQMMATRDWQALHDPRNISDIMYGTHQQGLNLDPISKLTINSLAENPDFQKATGLTEAQIKAKNPMEMSALIDQTQAQSQAQNKQAVAARTAQDTGSVAAQQGTAQQQTIQPGTQNTGTIQQGTTAQAATQSAISNTAHDIRNSPSVNQADNNGKPIVQNAPQALQNVQYQTAPNYVPRNDSLPNGGVKNPDGTITTITDKQLSASYQNAPMIAAKMAGITDPKLQAQAVNNLTQLDSLGINSNTDLSKVTNADIVKAGMAVIRSGVLGVSAKEMDNYSPDNMRSIVGQYLGERETIAHTVLTGNLNADGTPTSINPKSTLYSPNFGQGQSQTQTQKINPPPPVERQPVTTDWSAYKPGLSQTEAWQGSNPQAMLDATRIIADPNSTPEQVAKAKEDMNVMHQEAANQFSVARNQIVDLGLGPQKLGTALNGLGITDGQIEHANNIAIGRIASNADILSNPEDMQNPATRAQVLGTAERNKLVADEYNRQAIIAMEYQKQGVKADPALIAYTSQLQQLDLQSKKADILLKQSQAEEANARTNELNNKQPGSPNSDRALANQIAAGNLVKGSLEAYLTGINDLRKQGMIGSDLDEELKRANGPNPTQGQAVLKRLYDNINNANQIKKMTTPGANALLEVAKNTTTATENNNLASPAPTPQGSTGMSQAGQSYAKQFQ